jgi:hypothetical protein
METIFNYWADVNISGLFLVFTMVCFIWLTMHFAQSKVQESLGRKDLAKASRAKSRARCEACARPAIATWRTLRQAHRQSFPKSLAQTGAVGRDLAPSQGRQPRRSGRQGQKKASSGGSSDDGDGGPDGEPPHRPLQALLNYEDFGLVARLAPGTVKNLYCRSPESLPPAIHIPGHRGPLWHPDDVVRWFEAHRVTTPVAVTPKAKAKATTRRGRPRIAQAGKGGASC